MCRKPSGLWLIGDRPLIVLASRESMNIMPPWTEAQHQQAAMSTNGRLIVVEGSGHNIQVDKPAVVIDAVQQVVKQVRGH
jgi:pimeloyl-ACP methyl ester carboxylesterase